MKKMKINRLLKFAFLIVTFIVIGLGLYSLYSLTFINADQLSFIREKYECKNIELNPNSTGTIGCQNCHGCEHPTIITNSYGMEEALCDTPLDCIDFLLI